MLTVNVITKEESKRITGTFNGAPYNVNHTAEIEKELMCLEEAYDDLETAEELAEWEAAIKVQMDAAEAVCKDVIIEACPELMERNGLYYLKGRKGTYLPLSVPQVLVDLILKSIDNELSPAPVIKTIIRWFDREVSRMTQEKFNLFADYITNEIVDEELRDKLIEEDGYSYDAATASATYPDVQITKEGFITAYKYADLITEGYVIVKNDDGTTKAVKKSKFEAADDTVDPLTGDITKGKVTIPEDLDDENMSFLPPVMREQGDAFVSRGSIGHEIHVGTVVELLGGKDEDDRAVRIRKGWDLVNENDSISCVKGLHVGGRKYVQSYSGGSASHLLMCFVNPANIGAVVDMNWGDGAMRVRSYYTYGAVEGRTKSIYHASKFAAMADADWDAYRELIVGKAAEKAAKAQAKLDKVQ